MSHPSRMIIRHRRGFAAIFSITLIIVVGAALAAMGTYFALEASRTRSQAAQAQLRQLLTAGAVAAIQRADAPGPAKAARGTGVAGRVCLTSDHR